MQGQPGGEVVDAGSKADPLRDATNVDPSPLHLMSASQVVTAPRDSSQ